jgi:hypothetical protein
MHRHSNPLVAVLVVAALVAGAGHAAAVDYLIRVSSGGPGTVTPSLDVVVPAGGNQTFTFTPSVGNAVVDVMVDDVSVGSGLTEYTFRNVYSDRTLYVIFGPPPPPPPPPPGPLFPPPFQSYGTGEYPTSVAIADLNADGHSDLVTGNWSSSSVSVLLGYGDGAFGSQTSFPTGSSPNLVAIADMNADGRPDLATANYSSSTVSVLLGNGDGTFAPKTDFVTGSNPGSVAIRDLDGDGRLDLAVANGGSNTVSVLLGNGDGTFVPRTDYDAGTGPRSVAIGDLNGDGRFDLAVSDIGSTCPPPPCHSCYCFDSSYVSVLLGNGDGTFGPRSGFRCASDPQYVVISDLNADGRPDLTTANNTVTVAPSFSVLLGVGDGTFGTATSNLDGPSSLVIADLDADGRLDLAGTRGYGVSFWQGMGDGTFGPRTDFGLSQPGRFLAVGELNGDGRPDLAVVGGFISNTVTVLLHGDPRLTTTIALSSSPERAEPGESMFLMAVSSGQPSPSGSIRFLDVTRGSVEVGAAPLINGTASLTYGPLGTNTTIQAVYDGDIRYQGSVSNQVSIEIFVGGRMFSSPTLFNTGGSPVSVATSDLNADGRPDLAVANASSSTVTVLLGTGRGNFSRRDFDTGSIMSWSVAIADLNADGRPDLVTANPDMSTPGGNAVSVLLGYGNGMFAPKTIVPAGENAVSVAIADFNADGRPDLVTADSYPSTVSVLLGNGNGTFGPKTTLPAGNEPQWVTVSDLNADGWPDIVTGNAGSAGPGPTSISVFLGNGNGTFGPKTNFGSGSCHSVAIADLNADGRPDAVTANSSTAVGGNTVSVLLGKGDGTFGPKRSFATGSYPVSVTIGDIDGDGRLDLAVANRSSNTVSVLLGNGDGTFGAKRDYKTGSSTPFSVAIADFNADGRLDLAVTNAERYPGTVAVLLQADVPVATLLAQFDAASGPEGIELRWSFGDPSRVATVAVERAPASTGPWLAIAPDLHEESGTTVALDRTAGERGEYFYRLVAQLTAGGQTVFGPVSASRGETPLKTDLTLLSSNPTSRGAQVQYSLARAGRVRLEVLDVSGRVEETLADRNHAPGRYVINWDGVGRRGRSSPGLYFVRLVAPDLVTMRKLAIIQ